MCTDLNAVVEHNIAACRGILLQREYVGLLTLVLSLVCACGMRCRDYPLPPAAVPVPCFSGSLLELLVSGIGRPGGDPNRPQRENNAFT